jgi:FemAB-related protein (PEP-CTERM system-associated)
MDMTAQQAHSDTQHAESPITVAELTPARRAAWDAFIEECPAATFFHRSGWQDVLERAFGHSTHYLYAERDGAVCGVLPLAHVRSRLFGNALTSTPFCVYGGAAGSDEAAILALEDHAAGLADRLGVDFLELRNRTRQREGWPTKELYFTFRKTIDPDPEVNMAAIPRKQRAMVRKGIKAELVADIDDGVERFFPVYARSVRDLGTPVFAKRYFALLKEVFGDACEVVSVRKGNEVISAVMNFYFRDEVLPYYGGGTPAARQLKGYDFMYWEVMRRACERGIRIFDYGRSKQGTGSFSFKKHWGFEPEPLPYQYHLVTSQAIPDVNPLNPKYQLFIKMWQRLPLGVANTVGPWLSRSLG